MRVQSRSECVSEEEKMEFSSMMPTRGDKDAGGWCTRDGGN
jgi:hypothetical protein